jgi:hypothetical protein
MAQEAPPAITLDGHGQRQIAKELLVLVGQCLNRVSPRGFRHRPKRWRAPRVDIIANGVIMVAAHDEGGALPHLLYYFLGFRPIVDEITEYPQFVVRPG